MSYSLNTNFHSFEVAYTLSRFRFIVDDRALHSVPATTTSLTSSAVGILYAANTNSSGQTTNSTLDILAWSISSLGSAINNPQFYNNAATAETRTLKGGGGTLHSISIGAAGGANARMTLYDNTAGSGTIIAAFDLTKDQAIGTHVFGVEGVNFYNGLTYVTSGTMTNASVTIFWD